MDVTAKTVRVVYRVRFTPDEVRQLTLASVTHYDAVCRDVAETGWLRSLARVMENFPGQEALHDTHLDWRDLDILAKICESMIPGLSQETRRHVHELFAQLRAETGLLQGTLEG